MMPKKEFRAKTQRRQRTQRKPHNPLAIRTMPSLIKATLKLINSPNRKPDSFRYVRSCLRCTGRRSATDLISTITFSSTTKSARNPFSNWIPSKTTGMICCGAVCRPRRCNSCDIIPSYTLSNSPGPRARWMRSAMSTTSRAISFSVTSNRMDLFLCYLCVFAREEKEFHAKTQRRQSPQAQWTRGATSTSPEISLSVTSSQNIAWAKTPLILCYLCDFAREK
jgi:hypothetical protein